ncbi:hypothetical protein [Prauserella endophytica]|uniref:Uncharacterized protein n=1 Tax=Prauserella endophytica TaxID=1592324 RepID=A0ABY2S078_9PSEU|nr:hypothetical protein [Prauserella endophytica]TKG67030.1 hypothetical protein FCN18_24295 [Prauserella endophytica]
MIPVELLDKAVMVGTLTGVAEPDQVVSLLLPWIRDDPAAAAQVMVALADLDKLMRDAHAAYNRGDRSDSVDELERRYQAARKAKNRPYLALQKRKQDEGAA